MEDSETLEALWAHPLIEPLFYSESSAPDLDRVLAELSRFGEVVIASHDDQSNDVGIEQDWACSVRWRGGKEWQVASGATALIAALRCLMEALSQVERMARQSIDALSDE